MKIGILTFSSAFNFGAVLQCYGLFSSLKEMNHDVRVIDYRPEYLASYKPRFGVRQILSRHIKSLSYRIAVYRYWRKIYDGYDKFERFEMRLTDQCKTKDEISKIMGQFECVIVGSDQIWNTRFNGKDSVWYGSLKKDGQRWITYAASIGKYKLEESDKNALMSALSKFDWISVREESLSRILASINSHNSMPPTVLDPSLLAPPNVWKKWYKPIISGNYIVTYQARECDDVFRIAEILSAQLDNASIIPLDFYGNVEKNGYNTYVANPPEFISLIKNARCVVTTSFHGTAFSVITQTPFYTLKLNDGNDGRSQELLESIGLQDRLIDATDTPTFEIPNFAAASSKLENLRMHSSQYLTSALS